jgi:Na+/H+ antiporter NhaC
MLAAFYAPSREPGSQIGFWYSIIPPLTAILLAFVTGRVFLSLTIAIVVGGLLAAVPQSLFSPAAWLEGVTTAVSFTAQALTTKSNLQILAFIPPIFVMVTLIFASGGFSGVIKLLLCWVNGKKSAQLVTFLMGLICFIDDYTNAMVIGSAMRPVTDRFGVSREKLAFLVDATSAPIAGLAVISTWIAYEVGLFIAIADQLGIQKDGYSIFFDALSFRFYCIIMIIFIFLNILLVRDFGPMRTAEKRAKPDQNQLQSEISTGSDTAEQHNHRPRAINAILPLAGLIILDFTGLWLSGGGPAKLKAGASALDWVYWRQVIADVGNTTIILFYAALFGLTLALICARFSASLSLVTIGRCFRTGLKKSLLPLIILTLAWSLKNCCDTLKTGTFLASLLAENLSPLWFPALLFVTASVVSFATGTSYGTMAILIPTAIPIAFALDGQNYGLTTIISFGSVLDGAIFGDHCSPISDTTIMSSISSSCGLMRHVRTQLPYSLFVAALALTCGYIPSAFGLSWGGSITLAILIMVGFFMLLAHLQKRRPAKPSQSTQT